MAFTDLIFLFVFLPLVWLLYTFGFKKVWGNPFLFLVSLIFCAWGSLYSLVVLLVVLVATYAAAKGLDAIKDEEERRKIVVYTSAFFLIVLLVYRYLPVWFSFLPFFSNGVPAPLRMPAGLSFYLFSCFSCVFDVWNRRAPAPKSFVDLGIFAGFFARLNMGPIAHYAHDYEQLAHHPQTSAKNSRGVELFLQGIFMKVIIADGIDGYIALLGADASWLGAIMLSLMYLLRIYFDFAGYSRMARGLGSLFGFTIPANFNKPYSALSVQDFWRRWHISLTDWFRDYVYIPLGGNRVDKSRWMLNILIVWLLTGLWHGATLHFIVWGLLQAGFILMEKNVFGSRMNAWPRVLRHVYVIVTQMIAWTIFTCPTLLGGLGLIARWFGIGASGFASSASLFALTSGAVLWILAIAGCTNLPKIINGLVRRISGPSYAWVQAISYALCFFIALSSLVSSSSLTFLYAVF